MSFRDIAGHAKALQFLRRSIASGRAGASLVFHGPEGVGRRAMALALAQAFNCPVEPGEGCGRCDVCTRIAHVETGRVEEGPHKGDARAYTHHPDVHLLVPGREEIRIDEVRLLRQNAQRRPFEGKRSVFIIDPAERMTAEAANALLKSLEEPPPSSCIILIASDAEALLPTVRSRCRLVPFHPLSASEVAAHLARTRSMSSEDAALVASLSGGRLGRAIEFDLDAYRGARAGMLEVLARLSRPAPRAHVIKDAERMGSRGDDADALRSLETLETLLRDAMIVRSGAPPVAPINADLEKDLQTIAGSFGPRLPWCLDRIRDARRDLASNVNKQLLLEVLLLDLAAPAAGRGA